MTPRSSGIIRENFKSEVRPQDDFYRHVNGSWLDTAQIPADRAVDGSFYALRDQSEERVRLATDPHSPAEFRCNQIVKNFDQFAEAFDVKPGDRLYLDPKERVRIW